MTEDEETIRGLKAEHEELQFLRFGFDEAWEIGQDLVAQGRRDKLPIAIDVSLNGQTIFHVGLPGSSPDNDQWLLRKSRIVQRFHQSSLLFATQLRMKGRTLPGDHGLSLAEYAPSGGAVPLRIRNVGVVGSISVSGLKDSEDHRLVVEAIRRHLAGKG
ncbi:MAG: heme-degrading domain-containing protein [Rectinemataceae bacterium]